MDEKVIIRIRKGLNKPFHSQSVKATYNGEAYDPRTSDIYLRARYYNTHTGTFTQSIFLPFSYFRALISSTSCPETYLENALILSSRLPENAPESSSDTGSLSEYSPSLC